MRPPRAMKGPRGNAVLLITLFLLALLGVALYLLAPRRDLGDVQTHVVDTMVATLDGFLHRFGVSLPDPSSSSLWKGAPILGGIILGLFLARRRSPRP